VALDVEERVDVVVPQGQVVPEERSMPEIVRLVPHAYQAVVVQEARHKHLARHIYEVVSNVELEVDIFVERLQLFVKVAVVQDLNRVLSWLEIYPDLLRRFVLVKDECFEVTLVGVVILVPVVRLLFQVVIPLAQVELEDLVVIGAVKDFYIETHFHFHVEILAVKHLK
jgi:hypothetical protein